MLVKSFTDNLAWDVQRQLVNTYFRVAAKVYWTAFDPLLEVIKNVGLEIEYHRWVAEQENR